jgi:hypothetical protein
MVNKKNNTFAIVLLIIISALICTIFVITSFNRITVYADDGGYTISSYDINVNVNENNILNIVEDIKVNFSEERHGIYREIPIFNNIQRADGTSSKQRTIITNIDVNETFDTYIENDKTVIKIGDSDKYVSGEVNYKISYNYNLGKDKLDGNDELYFNLVGNDWDTTISNLTFL